MKHKRKKHIKKTDRKASDYVPLKERLEKRDRILKLVFEQTSDIAKAAQAVGLSDRQAYNRLAVIGVREKTRSKERLQERDRVMERVFNETKNVIKAAQAAGVSERQAYNRLTALGVRKKKQNFSKSKRLKNDRIISRIYGRTGNVHKAALAAGVSDRTVRRRLRSLGPEIRKARDKYIRRIYEKTGSVRAVTDKIHVSKGHVHRRLAEMDVELHRETWTRPKIREALDVYAETRSVQRVIDAVGMSRSAVNRLLKQRQIQRPKSGPKGRHSTPCPPGYERVKSAAERTRRSESSIRNLLHTIDARPLDNFCYKISDVDRAIAEAETRKRERSRPRHRLNTELTPGEYLALRQHPWRRRYTGPR